MGYEARVLCDSATARGERLVTFEVTFPRIILSEFNTHCMLSRNSASSRAVPVKKKLLDVLSDPFIPTEYGVNRSGMSAEVMLRGDRLIEATSAWLRARDRAVWGALELVFGIDAMRRFADEQVSADLVERLFSVPPERRRLNVHKQVVNRLIEPFMFQTVITTATEWSNFFALRTSGNAQPEIRQAATLMLEALAASRPESLGAGEWHTPLVQPDELTAAREDPARWILVSAGRCARVSYLTHHGKRSPEADIELAERLLNDGHLSPFEHVARAMSDAEATHSLTAGKLRGWTPYRSLIPMEHDYSLVLQAKKQRA